MLYVSSYAISVVVLLLDIRKHAESISHTIRRPSTTCFDLSCNVWSTTKSTTTKKWSLGLTLKLISVVADRHRLTNLTFNGDEVYQPLWISVFIVILTHCRFDVIQLCCIARQWDGCRLWSVCPSSVTDALWLNGKSEKVGDGTMLATFYKLSRFLRATAECFARLSHRLGVRLFICLFVCPSHPRTVSKRCKIKLQNFYRGLPQGF